MYHLFPDVRVSRRLVAHFITDSKGRVVGQHRLFSDAIDQLFELVPGRIEIHTATQVLTVELLTTAQVSADAHTLATGQTLTPQQVEAEIEG